MNLQQTTIGFLCLTFPFLTFGQYQQSLIDSREWHVLHYFEAFHNNIDYVDGDSTINDQVYKKLQYSIYGSPNEEYTMLLREDTTEKKIYQLQNENEILLYDFSVEPGDTLIFDQHELVLDSISNTIISDGGGNDPVLSIPNPKVFYFSTSFSNTYAVVWVEGIGSLSGFPLNTHPWGGGSLGETILCHFDESGFKDYFYNYGQTPDECSLSVSTESINPSIEVVTSPNPTKGLINIKIKNQGTTKKITSLDLYNAVGELLFKADSPTEEMTLYLNSYSSGVFFLILHLNSGEQIIQKIIKI